MIEPNAFTQAWAAICARFGREVDDDQAAAYFDFLDDQLDTDAFLQAARSVWATAKYFPRPADFLLVGAGGEWRLVLAAAEGYTAPAWEWRNPWGEMTERTREACRAIGGMTSVRALWEKDVVKLKAEWERAYEQATAELVLSLPSPGAKLLPTGT